MTVWEKCNELKGTNETRQGIADWAYMNRICPIMFGEGLELDEPYPQEMSAAARRCCDENKCDMKCLYQFLDTELSEARDETD